MKTCNRCITPPCADLAARRRNITFHHSPLVKQLQDHWQPSSNRLRPSLSSCTSLYRLPILGDRMIGRHLTHRRRQTKQLGRKRIKYVFFFKAIKARPMDKRATGSSNNTSSLRQPFVTVTTQCKPRITKNSPADGILARRHPSALLTRLGPVPFRPPPQPLPPKAVVAPPACARALRSLYCQRYFHGRGNPTGRLTGREVGQSRPRKPLRTYEIGVLHAAAACVHHAVAATFNRG